MISLVIGIAGLAMLGPDGVQRYEALSIELWSLSRSAAFDTAVMIDKTLLMLVDALWLIAPFLALMFAVALAGPLLMSGWSFSTQPLKPQFSRLSPAKGIKRMFSLNSLVELLKSLAKVVLLGIAAFSFFHIGRDQYFLLGSLPLGQALQSAFSLMLQLFVCLLIALFVIAGVDVPWQQWEYARKLRMTRQELKEENKENNGNPEIKAKIRNLQISIANRRMLLDVPTADVVVINPTHYSVALKYNAEMDAPQVIASGVDEMALRIREIARESGVPLFEAPPLTRALYRFAEVGEAIPVELYMAVAQVLAYIFQVQRLSRHEASRLTPPGDLPLPPEMDDGEA